MTKIDILSLKEQALVIARLPNSHTWVKRLRRMVRQQHRYPVGNRSLNINAI